MLSCIFREKGYMVTVVTVTISSKNKCQFILFFPRLFVSLASPKILPLETKYFGYSDSFRMMLVAPMVKRVPSSMMRRSP